jgi:hypothetical protein
MHTEKSKKDTVVEPTEGNEGEPAANSQRAVGSRKEMLNAMNEYRTESRRVTIIGSDKVVIDPPDKFESETTAEREPTAAEVADRLARAAKNRSVYFELKNVQWQPSHHPGRLLTIKDEKGRDIVFYSGGFIYQPDVVYVANSNELALTDEPRTKGQTQGGQQPEPGPTPSEETTARLLINSAIAEVDRSRELMRRDDEEIQRLKEETRAILRKLAA